MLNSRLLSNLLRDVVIMRESHNIWQCLLVQQPKLVAMLQHWQHLLKFTSPDFRLCFTALFEKRFHFTINLEKNRQLPMRSIDRLGCTQHRLISQIWSRIDLGLMFKNLHDSQCWVFFRTILENSSSKCNIAAQTKWNSEILLYSSYKACSEL